MRRRRRWAIRTVVLAVLAIVSARTTSAAPPPTAVAIRDELNLARARPDLYARYLEEWPPRIRGNLLPRPGQRPLRLKEGAGAVREAVRFLRAQPPRSPLTLSPGMSLGAGLLAREQAHTGAKGHRGADGSGVAQRLRRHGEWRGKVAELVQYGGGDAREIVALLLVDDGVPGRGHRAALFDADYRCAGVVVGPHPRYRRMCVITLASSRVDSAAFAFAFARRSSRTQLSTR